MDNVFETPITLNEDGSLHSVTLQLSGDPVGKGRPRFTAHSGFARAYTPARTANEEARIKGEFLKAANGLKFGLSPLELFITASFSVPSSASKKAQTAMLAQETDCTKKPDLDNVIKLVCDALNKAAYEDDKQITQIVAFKRWAQEGSLLISLVEAGK